MFANRTNRINQNELRARLGDFTIVSLPALPAKSERETEGERVQNSESSFNSLSLSEFCTRGGNRTRTSLRLLVFETNASTSSATRAVIQKETGCENIDFFTLSPPLHIFTVLSANIMYYLLNLLRYLFCAIDLLLITAVMFILSLLPTGITKGFFPTLYKKWSLYFFRFFGVREHYYEKFQKPFPQQYILISNHPSGIELLWLPYRFDIIPLGKEEIKNWFIIGRITKAAGTIFVKRRERASRHAASDACLQALREGKNVLIFPEGGCYGKSLNPFYAGAFRLSKASGVPVLPVYVYYEEENTYEWGDFGLIRFMLRVLFLPRNRHAHLYVFDAFSPSDYATEEEFHDKVYKFYQSLEDRYRIH